MLARGQKIIESRAWSGGVEDGNTRCAYGVPVAGMKLAGSKIGARKA